MKEKYYLYFVETHDDFINIFGDMISRLKSISYWEDFKKYHYPSLVSVLSDIVIRSQDKGDIINDNSTTCTGMVFTVTNMTITRYETIFDVVMNIPDIRNHTNITITFEKLVLKIKYDNVDFTCDEIKLVKESYSDYEWKVLEKVFGFKEAINMCIHGPLRITGYGALDVRKEK